MSMDSKMAATPQPDPKTGTVNVADVVIADIEQRVEAGLEKYGTKLQAHNGRDAMWDLYQELIDAVMYVRQSIVEQDDALSVRYFVQEYRIEVWHQWADSESKTYADAVAWMEEFSNPHFAVRIVKVTTDIVSRKLPVNP